ncbi:MAG: hypothetical protein ACXW4B_01295 [Micavibrio sp.]
MRLFFLLTGMIALSACAGSMPDQPHPYQDYLNQKNLGLPETDDFQHCRGYGCAFRDRVSLDKNEWRQVKGQFRNVKNADQERQAIGRTIGMLEQKIGVKTNTAGDIAGTFDNVGKYQLDCVDESTNTTIYLALLEKHKLLQFHKVSAPTTRTPFTGMASGRFWPHQTAVIFETASGQGYAVDSWYRDNGFPADIVKLDDWLYGWGPDDAG